MSGRTQFQVADPTPPPERTDSPIPIALIAIDRGAIASVRSIGFALHCRRNKSSAERGQRADKCRFGGRSRQRADASIVIFDFRLCFFRARTTNRRALSSYTREIRHVGMSPTTSAGRCDVCDGIDPDTPLWNIELFPSRSRRSSYFFLLFFSLCADPTSRLRAAVVIRRKSIQLCKDRALEHRCTLHRAGEDVSFVIVDQSALLLPR